MDIPNIFTEDTDLNIIKSWLCNATDGQTYSISNRFLPRIKVPPSLERDFIYIEQDWDEIIGWKHDYKVDDPEMEKAAKTMLDNINTFIDKVNAEPCKYFKESVTAEQNGQGKGKLVLMAIDKSKNPLVRKVKVVEDCTKAAVQGFIEEWNDELDVGLTLNEVEELAQRVWNDGSEWWFDNNWCIQMCPIY